MKFLVQLIRWVVQAAVFFTLFAFALNNEHDGSLHFFFGRQWHGPMVLIVLGSFTLGLAVGVLSMVPRWWKNRRAPGVPGASAPPLPGDYAAPPPPSAHGL